MHPWQRGQRDAAPATLHPEWYGDPLPPYNLPTASPTAGMLVSPSPDSFQVRYHPDGGLFVGDQVSIEVIAPADWELQEREVSAHVFGASQASLGTAKFERFGIGRRRQATFYWAWDTSAWKPGEYEIQFSLIPTGTVWRQQLELQDASLLPPPEPQARWATTESDCCNIYYITGTAAERDLEKLVELVDTQAAQASQSLQVSLDEPVAVVFLSRVLGHGGFASQEVSLSYLDRNYAGTNPGLILHHELIHILDHRSGGIFRPSVFVEGLAVYLSGGHFKPEPLLPRAAALIEPGWYLPLETLLDDFYNTQHEIGYLQAGALVEFMVNTWGWEAFSNFYRNIPLPLQSQNEKESFELALQQHFSLSIAELEQLFLDHLAEIASPTDYRQDVRLTVDYYDTVRRYQQAYDPSAYFLSAWMLDGQQLRQRGIVADYLRTPQSMENLALELMLAQAGSDLQQAEFVSLQQLLEAVNLTIAAAEQGMQYPFGVHPLARDYFQIAQMLTIQGYQVQRIHLQGDQALVWVSQPYPQLLELELARHADGWMLMKISS